MSVSISPSGLGLSVLFRLWENYKTVLNDPNQPDLWSNQVIETCISSLGNEILPAVEAVLDRGVQVFTVLNIEPRWIGSITFLYPHLDNGVEHFDCMSVMGFDLI